ncbi:DUF5983 family protein [Citrobacter freundii]
MFERSIPPVACLNGIQCSTAHITAGEDNALLFTLSHQRMRTLASLEWIIVIPAQVICSGRAWSFPVLRLKRLGLSKACRRLLVTLMRRYAAWHCSSGCLWRSATKFYNL